MPVDLLLNDPFKNLWPATLIDIIKISTASGNPEKVVVYAGLQARHTQKQVEEAVGPFQEPGTKVVDVFYVSRGSGVIPGISEEHQVRWQGHDRKILQVVDQGGQGQTLEILAEMAR